jgi:hypothetical protein
MNAKAKASLVDSINDLVANPPIRQGYHCKVYRILNELSDDDRRALTDLIDKSKISASAVARLLNQHGYEIKDATVTKHRRRFQGSGCRCNQLAGA